MGFKDMVAADIKGIFLNDDEFAEKRNVIYDGVTYSAIPIVLTGLKEQDRKQSVQNGDHGQGIYLVTSVLHCSLSDLGNNQPEKGTRIKIQDDENSAFYREFYVATSVCEMGMLRIELEEIDE